MKTPYHFDFNGDNPAVLDTLPEGCKYPLSYARTRLYYTRRNDEILSQQLNYSPFFIDLIELKLSNAGKVDFRINERQLFLFFMLSGGGRFTTSGGRPLLTLPEGTFLTKAYSAGNYSFRAPAGKHIALVINIRHDWLQNHFPLIFQGLSHDTAFCPLPLHRINKAVDSWLTRIYTYTKTQNRHLDWHLRKYITFILEHYETRLVTEPAVQIREYIEQNFTSPELTIARLCDYFCMSDRTLRNTFQRKYSESPHHYITRLRIEMAEELIEHYGLAIREVYEKVGYTDERTYRYARERYAKNR